MITRKIEIDTEKRSVRCDGESLEHITNVSFDWNGQEGFSNIRIEEDAKIVLSGILAGDSIKSMKCECGYYVGEFVGASSDVICPSCGKVINS